MVRNSTFYYDHAMDGERLKFSEVLTLRQDGAGLFTGVLLAGVVPGGRSAAVLAHGLVQGSLALEDLSSLWRNSEDRGLDIVRGEKD